MSNYGATGARAGGCGCGGAGSSPAVLHSGGTGGCSCGSDKGQCESCSTETISRPNFFSGQLLTEDDLQLLGDYATAKNRLHNRHLFGDGVVCGLEVTCHPCGSRDSGKVIVAPGYALDCCGNDIVVQCQQTVDINQMVHALRQERLGGFDCGNPCAKPKTQNGAASINTTSTPSLAPGGNVPLAGERTSGGSAQPTEEIDEGPNDRREYCLYVRYCESLTDPVSPYATDDPCGPTACHETRVREGFRFELRCREENHPPISVLSRVCECFQDFPQLQRTQTSLASLRQFAATVRPGLQRIRAEQRTPFEESSVAELRRALDDLSPAAPAPGAAAEPPIKEHGAPAKPAAMEGAELIGRVMDTSRRAATILARFLATDVHRQAELKRARPELEKLLETATKRLGEVRQRVGPLIDTLPTSWDREYARANLEVIERLTAAPAPGTRLPQAELQRLGEGIIITEKLAQRTSNELEAIREWLLDRLDANPHITDCTLRRDLNALVLPTTSQLGRQADAADVQRFADAAEALAKAFQRYVLGCVCNALNPACQPCDDPAVLIACLQVEGCDIVRVCNLDRKFVLTGPTLRYWLPVLAEIGEALERLCCPLVLCDESADEGATEGKRILSWSRLATGLLQATLARACGADYEESRLSVVGQAVAMRLRTAPIPIIRNIREPAVPFAAAAAPLMAASASGQLKADLMRELRDVDERINREIAKLRDEMAESKVEAAHRRKRPGQPEG